MRQILLDTEKLISLGTDGVDNLSANKYVVTQYTYQEICNKNLTERFDSTSIQMIDSPSPSWPDFELKYSNGDYQYYEWRDGNSTTQVIYSKSIFGSKRALCGKHNATIQISKVGGNSYYLCDKFLKNADLSDITALILDKNLQYVYTGDRCLGIVGAKINLKYNSTNLCL